MTPEETAAYQEAYREKFIAQHGLSPATMRYRLKHGIPLDQPLSASRGEKSGAKMKKVRKEKPSLCVIEPAAGKPEKCHECGWADYRNCLDFALENHWDRGWKICRS